MKHLVTIALSILIALGAQAAPDASRQLQTAQLADSAYRIADYQQAASLYEEVLASGFASADLYYNLGNTYYRLDRFGLAILNYERALRLRPGMSDARENLALANSHTVDRIAQLPRLFVVNWYISLITRISPSSWRVLSLLFFLLAFVAVAVLILSGNITLRKSSLAVAIVAAVLFILSLILMLASTRHFNVRAEAIVLEPSVVVKSSPELQSADKLILHEGTKVTIAETLSGWHKITLSDGTTGWCQSSDIAQI
ncbi:MAG: tetratricopeptide repeat protein [Bacteroidales bacterium]|nr:tetratricopeptide repeat protein [Bacteroidales bacterium]